MHTRRKIGTPPETKKSGRRQGQKKKGEIGPQKNAKKSALWTVAVRV